MKALRLSILALLVLVLAGRFNQVYAEEVTDKGTTPTAGEALPYDENHWLKDFEVHFFVSLPFTAFYSYVGSLSLDSIVQGSFPAEFRQANAWMIIGFAVGSSLAIALSSIGQIPDQSVYQVRDNTILSPQETEQGDPAIAGRCEIIRINY